MEASPIQIKMAILFLAMAVGWWFAAWYLFKDANDRINNQRRKVREYEERRRNR
jgi:hypothetical protein